MSIYPLIRNLTPISLPLSSIFLDPNNPRFVTSNWTHVPNDEIDSEAIQDLVRQHLVDQAGVEKLKMNMEVNGYLPVDRVIVREFKPGRYVVLEGNRRICAAKLISAYTQSG